MSSRDAGALSSGASPPAPPHWAAARTGGDPDITICCHGNHCRPGGCWWPGHRQSRAGPGWGRSCWAELPGTSQGGFVSVGLGEVVLDLPGLGTCRRVHGLSPSPGQRDGPGLRRWVASAPMGATLHPHQALAGGAQDRTAPSSGSGSLPGCEHSGAAPKTAASGMKRRGYKNSEGKRAPPRLGVWANRRLRGAEE